MDEDDFEKDKLGNFNLDDEQNKELNEPIDGQIGIEELYVRNEEEQPEQEEDAGPIDNQISFDEIVEQEQEQITSFLNEEKEKPQSEDVNNRKELDDFFKDNKQIEKEQQKEKEKAELNAFFNEGNNEPNSQAEEIEEDSVGQEDDFSNIGYRQDIEEEKSSFVQDEKDGLIDNNEDYIEQNVVDNEDIKQNVIDNEEDADEQDFTNDNYEQDESNDLVNDEEENEEDDLAVDEEDEEDDFVDDIEEDDSLTEDSESEEDLEEFEDDDIENKGNGQMSKKKKKKTHKTKSVAKKTNSVKTPKKVVANKATNFNKSNLKPQPKEETSDVVKEERVESSFVEPMQDDPTVKENTKENMENKTFNSDEQNSAEVYSENFNEEGNLEREPDTRNEDKKVSLREKEEFFLNEDNSQMVKEVDKINSEIGDVELKVGKDAFGDYVSDALETETVKEEEVKVVKEKVISENSGEDVVDGMLYKNLDTVLHESMIPYSEHVILDRAIPRVEDGLKPVQRRILYSMIELGVTPDKPFRKSARIVGDCLGKYHPHGDSSVYDAMVRLAQPFNTNMLLVEGHGNFGSVDGDGAAAMRYTEARLAPIALELLRDLDKNTVRWGLNFDDTLKEPEILPGRFPNLLVNGSTGIAVGLATNIPPHNLAETIDGVVAYIDNPNITLKEMMRIIKGPDFPTGGYILNSSEIKEAYQTGRGKIYIRAKMHIETNNNDKKYIVITELPYQVNKSSLLQKINSFKEEDKYGLGVISEVRDESDRDGLRAVIRLKKDANVKKVYEALIKYTELQVTFGVNMVAIANGKPKQMGLLDIISYYTEYQREIILRRSKFECEQAKEREHILSGLLIAIKNIDAVVKIIKTSKNTTEAKSRLRAKFYLTEKQAQAILDMRLARLTSLEVYKLEEEIKKLRELIKRLTNIINSKKEQLKVVRDEILQIKREHKKERQTKILKTDDTLNIAEQPEQEKEVAGQKMVILKNAKNNFKCLTLKQYNAASKEFSDSSTLFEAHNIVFETETGKSILAFSSLGNCFKVSVKDFGESRYKDKGINERIIFKELTANETIVALVHFDDVSTKENLLFLTKFGMIKKTPLSEYALLKKYFQAMKLKDGDEIFTIVKEPQNAYNYVFVTKMGMVLKAENKDVPVQGRVSGGVKGMAFSGNDYCVCSQVSNDEGEVVLVTDKGNAKRVVLTNIDKMVRYRKGLKIMALTNETGKEVVFASVVKNPYTVVAVNDAEEIYSKSTDLIPIETRIGKGKVLEKSKKNMQIKQVVVAL